MGKEIEAKIKIGDHERQRVEEVVSKSGRLKYARFEVNIFYDTEKRKLKGDGQILRLRKESYPMLQDVVSMTFKGKRKEGKFKIRDEHEFTVSSFEEAQLMLQALGYKETFRFEKRRRSYIYEDCLVEFDTLPYIGEFVEVEGDAEEKIHKVLKAIGLDKELLILDGYGSLLNTDAEAKGRSKKMAVFDSPPVIQ